MPVIVDLTCLCDGHTDGVLETIFKAQGEDPPDASIWDEHPNPYIRRVVEMFTRRGLDRVAGMNEELQKWIGGGEHKPGHVRPPRPAGAMERWSPTEIGLTRLYLEALPPAEFELDDWLLLVDYLVNRYLPAADLRTEAEWLATRSNLMGRVQAAMAEPATEAEADHLLAALPATADEADKVFGMKPAQRAALDYGSARCAENVAALTDTVRHRMRRLIMDYTEAQFLGDKVGAAESLQSRLLDAFGEQNRDWRRIAVTEAGENLNQGMIASLPVGARVKRVEKYRGACAFCRSIDGKIMTVAAPGDPKKDGEKAVWPGKTNIGRSASPKKRSGGDLVDREPHEKWWPAAGVQHPNCRGMWLHLAEGTRKVDPKFSAWMDEALGRSPT